VDLNARISITGPTGARPMVGELTKGETALVGGGFGGVAVSPPHLPPYDPSNPPFDPYNPPICPFPRG
jgi:hypothetical protein